MKTRHRLPFPSRLLTLAGGLALAALTGVHAADPAEKPIHPQVFDMVKCWISDTASPVVTEINLDAVAKNRNQFDDDAVRRNGEWIEAKSAEGSLLRYRPRGETNGLHRVTFESNGGGTLTESVDIEYEVTHREFTVNGKPVRQRVLKVVSIADTPRKPAP